jgi:hypothetical protein
MNVSNMGSPGYNAIGLVLWVSINALSKGTRNIPGYEFLCEDAG